MYFKKHHMELPQPAEQVSMEDKEGQKWTGTIYSAPGIEPNSSDASVVSTTDWSISWPTPLQSTTVSFTAFQVIPHNRDLQGYPAVDGMG